MKKEKRVHRESSGGAVKNQTEKPGAGAAKAQSPFHEFQAKSLSIIDWIASLKRQPNDKKQRAFLESLEIEVADLVLKALKVTNTPTWRVNPRDLHPSSMDRFLYDGIAGLSIGHCETLMSLCQTWEMELRNDPASNDRTFAVLVLPFLGELSEVEKSSLAGIYGRWGTLLKDEMRRQFKTEYAGNQRGNPPNAETETFSPEEVYNLHVETINAQFLNALASAKTEVERITLRELMALVQDLEPKRIAIHEALSRERSENATERGDWSTTFKMEDAITVAAGILHLTGNNLGRNISDEEGLKSSDIAKGSAVVSTAPVGVPPTGLKCVSGLGNNAEAPDQKN